MRYSTLQEQDYGVGLARSQLLGDTSETMMDVTNNIESKNINPLEEGSVVSNLPLLFANGYPTSLEKITLVQLERFVTFMVQCSLGHDTTEVITEPRWWPKEVKFSNPLTRPKRLNENWMANLKKLVFRCYTYHRSEYLLRFCSYLARYPHEDLEYVNNWDSTTSLYHKTTGKLLVTFRNENMNYDKRNESPRKKLLTRNGVASCLSSKLKQQQHPIQMAEPSKEDIYLCDNCDADFISLEQMKEHERVCCDREQIRNNSRPATPDLSTAEPELRQDQFLDYFGLCSQKGESKSVGTNNGAAVKNGAVERTSRRVRSSINFSKFSSIPFSSPAGLLLTKKSKAMTEETQLERLDRIERYLIAPVLDSSSRPKWLETEFQSDRWLVTYKQNREKPIDDHVHQYKFVNSVKRKPMLSIHSQLLYVVCRPVYVLLTRLTAEQVNSIQRDPHRHRCPGRKVSIDEMESTARDPERLGPHVSSKRKAPSDEADASPMLKGEVMVSTERIIGNPAFFENAESYGENNTPIVKPLKEASLRAMSSDTVTMIDLCSSDEEVTSNQTAVSSDENRDPMNYIAGNVTQSQKLSSTKLHAKSHDQTGEWVSDNILNNSSENCTSNYCGTMLNAHTNLTPVLRPAP